MARRAATTSAARRRAAEADVHDAHAVTALATAASRAMESLRPDALFRDPLAFRLAGRQGRECGSGMVPQSGRGPSAAAR